MRVLICGKSSFVAKGLESQLINAGYECDSFSRGLLFRNGNVVKGDYLSIADNKLLANNYDVIVNFAVIKDGTVESNIDYIKSLVKLCADKGVKKLIHFSSMMVYGYHLGRTTEESSIEKISETWKKGYGEFKIAVDQYLISIRETLPFELVLVRPGYVLADNRPSPFIRPLPLGFAIIKGNSKSKQPVVQRDDIHDAVIKIIETEDNLPVYHFFPNNDMTKYRFARMQGYKHLIPLPKLIFKGIPFIMMKLGIMPKSLYSRFDGMYNETIFSSKLTEEKLKIKFK